MVDLPSPSEGNLRRDDVRSSTVDEEAKKAGRAVFLKHYQQAKEKDAKTDDYQDKLFLCLFIEIIASLGAHHMPRELRWFAITISTLALMIAMLFDFKHPRIVLYAAATILNAVWNTGALPYNPKVGLDHTTWTLISSPAFEFCLLVGKILLVFVATCWIRLDLVQRSRATADFLERACGLLSADFAAAEIPPAAPAAAAAANGEEQEEGEPRLADFTKAAAEELGLVVSRSSWRSQQADNEYLLVLFVMPRGLAERQGGIRAGDEILLINETSMDGASIDFAHSFIRQIEGQFTMVVRQNVNLVPVGNYYFF